MRNFTVMRKNNTEFYFERNVTMKTTLSRRGLIRFASFMLALVAVLAASNVIYMNKIKRLEYSVEASYSSAVEQLAQSADSIKTVLSKGRYASSPSMMTRLSENLTERAAEAKAALESLPVYGMSVDNLEKFLSQVGSYASSLSRKASAGGSLSEEEIKNVETLGECAERLSESLWELRTKMLTNDEPISRLFSEIDGGVGKFISDGFSGIEDGLKDMPKLIYDGPFSDHILERTPLMTQNAEEISASEALEKAAKALDEDSYLVLQCESSEEGKMPSYCFYSKGGRCAVSKNGGYIVYCIKSRSVDESTLTCEDAVRRADEYLKSLGISDMERTYYECYNNICTVNYACLDDGVLCYTDLIKVAVALDNGETVGFDARGYLVNHRERSFDEPSVSEQEAVDGAAEGLEVKGCRLAVIPTDSVEEKLCYELKCRSSKGDDILIYVNAETGEEEDILILLTSDDGVLTV